MEKDLRTLQKSFHTSPDKMVGILTFQHNITSSNLAIYIHWPFCESKCPYCDFNSYVTKDMQYSLWTEAYLRQIDYLAPTFKGKTITSIFFGGGTPSLMDPSIIKAIIDKIATISQMAKDIEITLEANPSSIEINKFKEFKSAGINRVSVGIQALNEQDLSFLGRKHSLTEAIGALEDTRNIFDNWSFDLIYARPNQSLLAWQEELNQALNLTRKGNTHISCYQLTIEAGTPFFNDYHNHKFGLPNQDLSADMFNATSEVLRYNGYDLYEISNHAKSGYASKHNLCYWNYDNYLGIGPGAHSRMSYLDNDGKYKMQAAFMEYKPDNFLAAKDKPAFQKITLLEPKEIIDEILMMGLRLASGIKDARLKELTGKSFEDILDASVLNNFIANDIVYLQDNILRINRNSLILHNYIVSRLLKS